MAGAYQWNGDQLKARLEREMGKRLDASAIAVTNHAKQLVSVEGTGVANQEGHIGGGQWYMLSGGTVVNQTDTRKGKKKKLIYNAFPSAPGEPPHTQTGRLKSSIAWERTELVARVGTNVIYGRWLELGTSRMAARPWLRRALLEMNAAVRAIINHPMDLSK